MRRFGTITVVHIAVLVVVLVVCVTTLVYVHYQFDWDNGRHSHPCFTLNKLSPCLINREYDKLPRDITLVTHLSIDRLNALTRIVDRWPGPIVAAVLVPDAAQIASTLEPFAQRIRTKQSTNAALRNSLKSAPNRHHSLTHKQRTAEGGDSDLLQFIETDESAAAQPAQGQITFLERFKHHGTRPVHPNRMITRSKAIYRIGGRRLLSVRRPHPNAHEQSAGPHLSAPAGDSAHVLSPAVPRHHRNRGDALPHDMASIAEPAIHHMPQPNANPLDRDHPPTPSQPAAAPPASASHAVPSFQFVYYVSPQATTSGSGGTGPPAVYPVNTLRNMAMQLVRTQLVFMLDVDFVPDESLYEHVMAGGANYFESAKTSVFVVPIFQHTPTATATINPTDASATITAAAATVPATKTDLLTAIQTGSVATNYKSAGHVSHALTDYAHWLHPQTVNDYSIQYQIPIIADGVQGFEPYVIGSSVHMPRYDERFNSYGGDKISYTYHLNALGFQFWVIAQHFIAHTAHERSASSTATTTTTGAGGGGGGGWYDHRNYHLVEEQYRAFIRTFLPPLWIAYIAAATIAITTLIGVAGFVLYQWYSGGISSGGAGISSSINATGSSSSGGGGGSGLFDGCCWRIRRRSPQDSAHRV